MIKFDAHDPRTWQNVGTEGHIDHGKAAQKVIDHALDREKRAEVEWEHKKTVGTVAFVGLLAVLLSTIFGG